MDYRSNRLSFREFKEDEFNLFYSLFSNEQVMKYTLLGRYSCEEELQPYFQKVLKNNKTTQNRKAYEFAVFLSSDESFIGMADIEIIIQNDYGGCGEIGYLLLPDFWGRGYATEIASKLLEISFMDIKLHKVSASCNVNNVQSKKVMEKVGMVKEGEIRKVRFKNGVWVNEYKYGILAEEWKNSLV